MPSHRAAEFTYYEELGVERNATPLEIRDSFRALVRLLHPDQQIDPELKAIAERQLRRINGVYSVLSDTEKRRRYDLSFDEDYPSRTVVFNPASNIDPKRFVTRLLWIGAAIIVVGTLTWILIDSFGTSSEQITDRGVIVSQPAGTISVATQNYAAQINGLQSELRAMRTERDVARAELARLHGTLASKSNQFAPAVEPAPAPPEIATSTEAAPEIRIAPAPPHTVAPAPSVSPLPRVSPAKLGSDPHQFAGFWFYAPNPERTNKNLYPPQFIEAVLTERNGVIHGRYRSRYRIVDRAISPDVNFEFTGSASGITMATPWTGQGGARGQITLSLAGENSLKFDWTTNELGSVQGLASGTATLTRRIE